MPYPSGSRLPGHAGSAGEPGRKVFAHYMMGLTCNQTAEHWAYEIRCAKEAGIDGFALNVGPSDHWTYTQLHHAYRETERAGGFAVFLSFDMAAGSWAVSQVVDMINRYKGSTAQMMVDGRPLVSTFEGPEWAENWPAVRSQAGDIFLVPDWSSLGPHGVGRRLDLIDGAFSWDAWPKPGQSKMTTVEDLLYKDQLRGKKYMMAVSPWFYTKLPQWNKNWYSSSESLWHDRWQQVLEVMPDFVQIITWNDFGESTYISDVAPAQVVQGAEGYVFEHPHSAFRAVLPYFIAAYKSGSPEMAWHGEYTAIAWYRRTPCRANRHAGTVWGQGGTSAAAHGARDVISVLAIAGGPASISVTIGSSRRMTYETDGRTTVSYFEVPFDSRSTGPVQLSLNGKTATGPEVMPGCADEVASLNAVAIRV